MRLGEPDVLQCLAGGDRDQKSLRVGHADVLAGEDDHSPGDEASILAGLQHPRQVVDGRLRIAATHALDERADHVVVVVSAVSQRAGAKRCLDVTQLDRAGVSEGARHLERGQHLAPVAPGAVDEVIDRCRWPRSFPPPPARGAPRPRWLHGPAARGGTACCGCAMAGSPRRTGSRSSPRSSSACRPRPPAAMRPAGPC